MDPITIGLAIAGAKKLLETATDIKDIAGSIEQLFSHTEKAEKSWKTETPQAEKLETQSWETETPKLKTGKSKLKS